MTALDLSYRHTPDARPCFIKSSDIEQVALQVRRQLGAESRTRLALSELARIDQMCVNDVEYEIWADIEHPVHDDDGTEVLGVFEFMPESSLDAVAISVTPASPTLRSEIVLSSLAHEMGHGIFDGPTLIAGARNRSLFDDPASGGVRAFRIVTDTPAHLQDGIGHLPDRLRLAEWRANEFMGLLLVPRDLLIECVTEEANRRSVEIKYQPSCCGPSVRDFAEIIFSKFEAKVSLPDITRAVAPRFGVTPKFIEVRMKKYGLIQENAFAS